MVLHVATLIGKEEPKDHNKTLVYIKGTDEVAKVVTLALFINDSLIFSIVLLCARIKVVRRKWERRGVGRRGDKGRKERVKGAKEENSIWEVQLTFIGVHISAIVNLIE